MSDECEVVGFEVTAFEAPEDELERQDGAATVINVLEPLLDAVARRTRVTG